MTRRERLEAVIAVVVVVGLVLWVSYGIAEVLIWTSEHR